MIYIIIRPVDAITTMPAEYMPCMMTGRSIIMLPMRLHITRRRHIPPLPPAGDATRSENSLALSRHVAADVDDCRHDAAMTR